MKLTISKEEKRSKKVKTEFIKTLKQRLIQYNNSLDIEKIADSAIGLNYADIIQSCNNALKHMILHNEQYLKKNLLLSMFNEKKIVRNNK